MINEEQFMAITGTTDPSVATSYIDMAGGNVEMAIGLYMEHGAGGGSGVPSAAAAASSASAAGPSAGGPSSNSMMDADAALAASMAAQEQEEDSVRAPDATRTMRLMDETAGPMGAMMMMGGGGAGGGAGSYGMMDPNMRMMQELMDEQLNRPSAFGSPAFGSEGQQRRRGGARDAVDAAAESKEDENDDDDDDNEYNYDEDEDEDEEMEDGEGETNNAVNPPRLSDMFAAPKHLLHTAGGFSGARQMAKDSKRWLLVNIQKDSEFSSHALNRDVWHNDLVENLVREGFIFWQEMDTHPEGQQFVQRYHVQQYPHVSMIDPRTGRLLWKKEGWTQQNPLTAESFAQFAMDFCSRNSFDRPPVAPKPPAAKGGGSSSATATESNSGMENKPVEFLTEEEQLEAAVKASMEDSKMAAQPSNSNEAHSPNNNASSEVQFLGNSVQPAAVASSPAAAPAAAGTKTFAQQLLEVAVPDEVEGATVKISFRMPNGSRVVRSFAGSDSVKVIYAFVAQTFAEEIQNDSDGKKEFSLKAGFPPKDLKSRMDESIDQAALHGEAIAVRWV